MPAATGAPGAAAAAPGANTKLLREVHALQRLVNASVAALKNSEAEAAAHGAPATAPSNGPPRAAAPPSGGGGSGQGGGAGLSVDAMIDARKSELLRGRGGSTPLR